MFISPEELNISADQSTKKQLITQVEGLFCGILPLEKKERKVWFYADEVYWINGWNKVNTRLLNITKLKIEGKERGFKAMGASCQELFFKGEIKFDPLLELSIESGYDAATLPSDLRSVMIAVAENNYHLGNSSVLEKSIKMWPREVEYATDMLLKKLTYQSETLKKQVWEVLARYSW